MKKISVLLGLCHLLFFTGLCLASNLSHPVPVPGQITLVDLGSTKCIPCKMMAPILAKLEKEYTGRASIIFIDVWEDKEEGRKFDVKAIPTQIFYDQDGLEVYRHQGFMSEEAIVSQFTTMGLTPNNQE